MFFSLLILKGCRKNTHTVKVQTERLDHQHYNTSNNFVLALLTCCWILWRYKENIDYRIRVFEYILQILKFTTTTSRSRSISFSIVSDYGLDDRGSIPDRDKRIFPLASASRQALVSIKPAVQWVPGVLSPGVRRGRGVMLTIHPI
jgi:hypothetical protein